VYSTNYLRTVLSAQSFLDGLLGTNCFLPNTTRDYDPTLSVESPVPDHSWLPDDRQEELVPVQVRDLSQDPLNAFDRNPDLIADLVSEVMLSDKFLQRDAAAAPLAARLANILPGLVRPFRTDFSKRSPSGINWVEAADHFVCRNAHKLDLSKFTDFEHDDRVEETLASLSHQTQTHLAWRFRQWYQNERLLAAIAAPPLREIANQLQATTELTTVDKRPFTVYSCHDITILGVLYGIMADFLADEASSEWRFWPKYGSHLVFELVRIKDGPAREDSHVVRVLLNGKPVLSANHKSHTKTNEAYIGRGPEKLLRVDDFLKVVQDLEDAGGHDYDTLLSRR